MYLKPIEVHSALMAMKESPTHENRERFAAMLYRIAQGIASRYALVDHDTREELVQSAVALAYEKLPRAYDPSKKAMAFGYVTTIIINAIRQDQRKAWARVKHERNVDDDVWNAF